MSDTLERISKVVAEKVKGQNVTPESDLASLGLDSLDKAEILINLEDEFKIEFTEEEMTKIKTVNDLAQMIEQKTK
ncbi:MAG: phosphopantetheine-binding protein [Bacilli bacterium]|jgi:acyl carrier protein|nr:phosphopantetheine-binding protein [Bacilli bacterium]